MIAESLHEIKVIKQLLNREFHMQDLGEATTFVGLKITRDQIKGEISMSQEHYTKSILKRFEMDNCKAISTPMETNLKLERNDENLGGQMLNKPYRELIGCLTYLMVASRPDLSAAVNYFSQFQNNPTIEHWSHAKRILRYRKGTINYELVYRRSDSCSRQIEGFADANWATDVNHRKSVSGTLFKVYGATISWTTRKQNSVSLSTTEAECAALADAVCEILWIKKLLVEIRSLDHSNLP